MDSSDVNDLARRGTKVRDILHGATILDDLRDQILETFKALKEHYSDYISVAVRNISIIINTNKTLNITSK